jgi:hypothetical protein
MKVLIAFNFSVTKFFKILFLVLPHLSALMKQAFKYRYSNLPWLRLRLVVATVFLFEKIIKCATQQSSEFQLSFFCIQNNLQEKRKVRTT